MTSGPGRPGPSGPVTCLPVDGVGEVRAGDDLAAVLLPALDLHDGDVLVVTSKVVSKAEGRTSTADRADVLGEETDRVVARRGRTTVARTRHGLVLAGAGIDASNVAAGTVLLLPRDPDDSARRIRLRLAELTGCNVAVVVSDTAGRAWRNGQTDIAIGAAGLPTLIDYAGRTDGYGNELAVTAPAVADEVAGLGDLVKGKLRGRPAAVVRGLDGLVLPPGEHGPGAAALVREESQDMFGLGTREAVLHAVMAEAADPAALRGFGQPASADEVSGVLGALSGTTPVATPTALDVPLPRLDERGLGRLEARLAAVAFAHGWLEERSADPGVVRFRPASP